MSVSIQDILNVLHNGGYVGIAVIIILTGYRQVWVWGNQLEASQAREQDWKNLALQNMQATSRTLDLADTLKGAAAEALRLQREQDRTERYDDPRGGDETSRRGRRRT